MSDLRERLLNLLGGALGVDHHGHPISEAHEALAAIWPEIIKLQGKILEYEHALEHISERDVHEKENMVYCPSCAALALSALNGVNRVDFEEIAADA